VKILAVTVLTSFDKDRPGEMGAAAMSAGLCSLVRAGLWNADAPE